MKRSDIIKKIENETGYTYDGYFIKRNYLYLLYHNKEPKHVKNFIVFQYDLETNQYYSLQICHAIDRWPDVEGFISFIEEVGTDNA